MTSPGEEARGRGPEGPNGGRAGSGGSLALLRGDSRAGKGKNALTFFREVNKVRESAGILFT